MIERVLAQCTVTDLEQAEAWYTALLGRGPDERPMDGLVQWVFGAGGLQVWAEPDRAGRCSVVLVESDLDEAAARATAAGVGHGGPQPGGGARILQLLDPDGNRVVLTGD